MTKFLATIMVGILGVLGYSSAKESGTAISANVYAINTPSTVAVIATTTATVATTTGVVSVNQGQSNPTVAQTLKPQAPVVFYQERPTEKTSTNPNLVDRSFLSKQLESFSSGLGKSSQDMSDRLDSLSSSKISFATVALGGTGLSTAPAYGQVLLGNSLGGYSLVATSSLGIPSFWNQGGALNSIYYSAGNVGVGTTSPVSALSVVGTTTISNGGVDLTNSVVTYDGATVFQVQPSLTSTFIGKTLAPAISKNQNSNTFIGSNIGQYLGNDSEGYNVFIGDNILTDPGGYGPGSSVLIGSFAGGLLDGDGAGYYSVAIGYEALKGTGTGYNYGNTTVGYQTLSGITTGNYNTVFGSESGKYVSSGGQNVLIGDSVASNMGAGSSNVFLGSNTGDGVTAGSNNILIGASVNVSSNRSNYLNIGNVIYSNSVAGGSSPAQGSVGIGTASPVHRLDVATSTTDNVARFTGQSAQCTVVAGTGFSCSSDERLKTNILKLNTPVLDKVLSLEPVNFNWNTKPDKDQQIGFIAQDVEKVLPDLVGEDGNGYKTISQSKFVPYIVKAFKELVESLKKVIVTKEVRTEKLCIEDVCVTKTELEALLRNANQSNAVVTPAQSSEE